MATISPSDSEVSSQLYQFTKAFVDSAEKVLEKLDEPSKPAKVIAQGVSLAPDFAKIAGAPTYVAIPGKQMADGVLSLSQEIFQKIKKNEFIAALCTDSEEDEDVKEVFKTVFISTAVEIYFAFKFQLEIVHFHDGANKNKFLALEALGAFAGERCFEQLLRTGAPKNLHRILVPSINNGKGYEFEEETKTTWKTLTNTADDKLTKITSYFSAILKDKLFLSGPNLLKSPTTAASFFDVCIPGFDPEIREIKSKLKGEKLLSLDIVVDKIKKEKKKDKKSLEKYYFLRSPFKIEAEKIKPDNLEKLNIDPSKFDRRPGDFACKDFSHLTKEILKKISDDEPYDITDLKTAIENIDSGIKTIDLTTKRIDSTTQDTHSDVKEMKGVLTGIHHSVSHFEKSLVRYQVPEQSESSAARTDVFDEINAKMQKQKEQSIPITIISETVNVFHRHNGANNTTTASEFSRAFGQKNPDCNVVLVNAENHESLEKDFTNLALNLNIVQNRNDFIWERVKDDLYERISDRNCLIVFNNAASLKNKGSTKNGIQRFLPSRHNDPKKSLSVLVSTLNNDPQDWDNLQPVLLDVFKDIAATDVGQNIVKHVQENSDQYKDLLRLGGDLLGSIFK